MIPFVWMTLLALTTSPQVLVLPAEILTPQVTWSDLNSDGRLDIWVIEDSSEMPDVSELWVHDGTWEANSFRRLTFSPVAGSVFPVGEGQHYWVRSYIEGQVLDFRNGVWHLVHDYQQDGQIRPGLEPVALNRFDLVPTFEGYILVEGPCLVQKFLAKPAMEVNKDRFKLTWPIPQQRDLNGDGLMDLVAAPIRSAQHGEAWLWYALMEKGRWQEHTAKLKFDQKDAIAGYQMGDLDGDKLPELVIMTRPDKDMSVFEEMGFVVYSGLAEGGWEPVASQTLKTEQNLWQSGPIEMDQHGITFYYFKGLINTRFRMDRYRWDNKGFVKPEADSGTWKLKDGDRDQIELGHDFNGDGLTDLALFDETGINLYYRNDKAKLPFSEKPDRVIASSLSFQAILEIKVGSDNPGATLPLHHERGKLRGGNHVTFVKALQGHVVTMWSLKRQLDGTWLLQAEPVNPTETLARKAP